MAPHHDERLTARLDGELPDDELRRLEADLAQDPALRAAEDRLRQARDAVVRHGPAQAPAGFADRVMDALDEEPRQGAWPAPFRVPVAALALAATAVLVLWTALPEAVPDDPRPATEVVIPEDAPAAGLAGSAGAPVVVMAPEGYVLATKMTAAEAHIAVKRAGGRVLDDGRVRIGAERLRELREALGALGTLSPAGTPRPVAGDLVLTLELTPL